MRILVTGHAGFIGFHVARRLIARGDMVVGLDNLNDYYDPALKHARLAELDMAARDCQGVCHHVEADCADDAAIEQCFDRHKPERVIHLAAQAGVRYSLENPHAYVRSNLTGFTNILEACRRHGVDHLTYASTSSVYGANTRLPFSEHHGADHPLQFYAATKRANELMAHAYSHLYDLPTTGLRFFTVYGPWGRPDMAPMRFAGAIVKGTPIDLYNEGRHSRDFTYVDDIVEGVVRASDRPAEPDADWSGDDPDPARSNAPWRIYNIGNSSPVGLSRFVAALEQAFGKKTEKRLMPAQPGEVPDTFADVSNLQQAVGYRPQTSLEDGLSAFAQWYRDFYDR